MSPEGLRDELEEREDVQGPGRGGRGEPVEEEVEEAQAEGVALFVESGRPRQSG